MISYNDARNNVKRTYRVVDEFNGHTAQVGLAFVNGRAIEVADCGCYGANTTPYASEEEMLYHFDSHRSVHFPQVIDA